MNTDLIELWRGGLGTWRVAVGRVPMAHRELDQAYQRLAGSWSTRLRRLGIDHAYDCLAREVSPQGGTWLDAGVGDASLSIALHRHARGRVELHGVDLCEAMLDVARLRLRSAGITPSLQQGDLLSLPYADDRFDVVCVGHVLEHLGDPDAALRELSRVLRPGGTLVVSATRHGLLGGWVALRWRVRCFGRRDLMARVTGAGLKVVSAGGLPGGWVPGHLSLAVVAQAPHGACSVTEGSTSTPSITDRSTGRAAL